MRSQKYYMEQEVLTLYSYCFDLKSCMNTTIFVELIKKIDTYMGKQEVEKNSLSSKTHHTME